MTRTLRVTLVAAMATLLMPFSTQTVFAQVRRPDVGGPVREYETQPAPAPTPRPPRSGVTGLGGTQGGVRYPQFIVEAVNFHAVDESGRDLPYTSDEVFAVFSDTRHAAVTGTYEQVNTGTIRRFEAGQSCIWPLAAPSDRNSATWSCVSGGARGPVSFRIKLYDLDPDYPDEVFTGHFCVSLALGEDDGQCAWEHSDVLFDHTFTYAVAEILGRLDPACRCFQETASHRVDGNTHYQVTFRITRVDTGGEPLGVDRNADSTGPVVYRNGTLSAALNQGFEFDGGAVVNAGGDLAFSRAGFASYLLTPGGGAKIWPGGVSARGYAACYAARNSASYVTTAVTPSVGQHACYVTSDGRVGELRVDALTPAGGGATLTASYTTWQ